VRNDNATTTCPACGTPFSPVRRQRWCSDACRQAAWRRHRSAPQPALPARAETIYECPDCETRYLGEQRCPDCNTWCRRLAVGALAAGGPCPHCDGYVALADILTENQLISPETSRNCHTPAI